MLINNELINMKKYNYLSVLGLLLLLISSCSSNLDKIVYNPNSVEPNTLTELAELYELEEEKANEVIETFSWTKIDLGYSAAVKYVLEMDLVGKEFENPQEVTATSSLEADVTVESLNKALNALAKVYSLDLSEKQAVEMRVKNTISDVATPIYTEVRTTEIQGYSMLLVPSELYMIGAQFGNWDWDSNEVVEMIPVNGQEGRFWAVKYFETEQGFKWNSERSWDGSFNELKTGSGFTTADGNAFVAEAGLYMVFVDFNANAITIEPAEVFGIGDAFGGWSSHEHKFEVSGELVTKTLSIEAGAPNLRMYATSKSYHDVDWWRMEFMLFDGVIRYRGNGNDQDAVTVTDGQVVTLDFNKNEGSIE